MSFLCNKSGNQIVKRNKPLDFDDVYVSLDMTSDCNKIKSPVDEALSRSLPTTGLELLSQLPEVKKKKGKPQVRELPDEIKTDLDALKMRSAFNSKRFYKKNDTKHISKDVQVGKVLDSPLDFYHSRLPKKMRKPTLVDELLADADFQRNVKRRYVQIIEKQPHAYKKEFKKLKLRYKRKTKK